MATNWIAPKIIKRSGGTDDLTMAPPPEYGSMPQWLQDQQLKQTPANYTGQSAVSIGSSSSPVDLSVFGNNRDIVAPTLNSGIRVYDNGRYVGISDKQGGYINPANIRTNQGATEPTPQANQLSIASPGTETRTAQGESFSYTTTPQISLNVPQAETRTTQGEVASERMSPQITLNNLPDLQTAKGNNPYLPNDILSSAQNVTRDLLTGDWTRDLATANNEAAARNLANQRANTAQQLQQAGLYDQGVGRQAMQGVEQAGMRQVADTQLANAQAAQNAKLQGLDASMRLSQEGRAQQAQDSTDKWKAFDYLMQAGDYAGAAKSFSELTGGGMDTSKLDDAYSYAMKSRDISDMDNVLNNFTELLSSGALDDSTAAAIGSVAGKLAIARTKLLLNNTFTDTDWAEIDASLNSGTDDTTNPTTTKFLEIAQSAIDNVETDSSWQSFSLNPDYANLFDGSDENTIELGRIAAALTASGGESPTISNEQREILKKYGLYQESMDKQLYETSTRDKELESQIVDEIKSGGTNKAMELYRELSKEFQDKNPYGNYLLRLDNVIDENGSVILNAYELNAINQNKGKAVGNSSGLPKEITERTGYRSKGWRRHTLNDSAKNWIKQNTGKIITFENKNYVVTGSFDPPDSKDYQHASGYIILHDIETGETKRLIELNDGANEGLVIDNV